MSDHDDAPPSLPPLDSFAYILDGKALIYLLATPERLAAGELLAACWKAYSYFRDHAGTFALSSNPGDLEHAEHLQYFADELKSAIAKAHQGTP